MFFVSRAFWTDLSERAASTVAQTAVALLTADAFTPLDLGSWENVAVASGVAGLIAVLKAFAVGRGGDGSTPSLLRDGLASRGGATV